MNDDIVKLTEHPDGFNLLKQYNKRIGCTLNDNELTEWLNKILRVGDPLGIIINNEIIAFLLLYCNNLETKRAYICNVYVDERYRGKKISIDLVKEAINICRKRNFIAVELDVAETNFPAYKVYKQCGFIETEHYNKNSEVYIKMVFYLKNL